MYGVDECAGQPGSTFLRCLRHRAITQEKPHTLDGHAKAISCEHRHHRVGARSNIGRAATHVGPFHLAVSLRWLCRVVDTRPVLRAPWRIPQVGPSSASTGALDCAQTSRSVPRRDDSSRAAHCSTTAGQCPDATPSSCGKRITRRCHTDFCDVVAMSHRTHGPIRREEEIHGFGLRKSKEGAEFLPGPLLGRQRALAR